MEHMKLLRNQTHTEKMLKTYEHDLLEMKKVKVKPQLMNDCVFDEIVYFARCWD